MVLSAALCRGDRFTFRQHARPDIGARYGAELRTVRNSGCPVPVP